jgi:acyl-CoA thioesterase FadM
VWPQDIDVFGHMNNGRYLQVMDVARVDWMRRTRILDRIWANRCSALLGGSVIRYCKALRPFERYRVHTSLIAWEARWAFLQHRCTNEAGELVALGYTRAALRNADGWVPPQRILDEVEPGLASAELPSLVRRWLGVDDGLVDGDSFTHLTDDASPDRSAQSVASPGVSPGRPASRAAPEPTRAIDRHPESTAQKSPMPDAAPASVTKRGLGHSRATRARNASGITAATRGASFSAERGREPEAISARAHVRCCPWATPIQATSEPNPATYAANSRETSASRKYATTANPSPVRAIVPR